MVDRNLIPIQSPDVTIKKLLPAHLVLALKQRSQLDPIQARTTLAAGAQSLLQEPLVGHSDWIRTLAFSPDGKTLLSGSKDKTAPLWSLKTELILRLSCGTYKFELGALLRLGEHYEKNPASGS